MLNEEKLQRIEKDGGKFVCRDGIEGRNPQEEEEKEGTAYFKLLSAQ